MPGERDRGAGALLKQLWLGLSAYRLFPGNVDHPGFVAAAKRIATTATAALSFGPVDVEVRGDRFLHEGEELEVDDDHLRRLALVCFERRVERLTVVAVPGVHDLDRLYALLTRDPGELAAEGDAGPVLRSLGVSSVVLSSVGPGLVQADHAVHDVAPGRGAPPVLDTDRLASELMLEDLRGSPADQAETLLSRLRDKLAEASSASGPAIDVHGTVHDLVADLPVGLRRSLVELLVDRAEADPVAESIVSTMNGAELARALVDLGRGGQRRPADIARALAQAGVRQPDVVELTDALESGREDAGTIIAGLEQLGIDAAGIGGSAASTVTDVIADYLEATADDDAHAIQAALVRGRDQMRAEAISALGDYLVLESDLERTGEALDLWAEELREALRGQDVQKTRWLVEAMREALLQGGQERRELFEAYVRRALEPGLVAGLLAAETGEEGAVVSDLLAPFDEVGVEIVLDLLAEEEDRTRRARLLGVAKRTVGDRATLLHPRLADPRWFVVRNALVLLGASGRADQIPHIERLAAHPTAAVRREVPAAIAAAGGAAAVPALGRLAREGEPETRRQSVAALGAVNGSEAADALVQIAGGSDDRSLRLLALEELALRSDGAPRLLELASGATRPRLPLGLRRRARSLARRGGRS